MLSSISRWLSAGSGGRRVECRTVNRGDGGSIPPATVSKLRQFRSPHMCLSEETLKVKAGGPFYLVSMPGKVKDPTQWGKYVACSGLRAVTSTFILYLSKSKSNPRKSYSSKGKSTSKIMYLKYK